MSNIRRPALAITLCAAAALVVTACAPEPPEAAPTSASPAVPDPAPTPSASTAPSAVTASLPADCAQAYSPDMLAALQAQIPPMNDTAITLLSTDQAPLLELLESVPTLRCTWGPPGPSGLATNVSLVDAAQSADILSALAAAGFGCEASGQAQICSIEQRGITLDDEEYVRGETHGVRDGVWVATSWINVLPDGYTQDVLDTVAG